MLRQQTLTVLTLVSATTAAWAQSTFTYQGRVEHLSKPANGEYDMIFALYDAAVGGNLVSSNTRCGDGQISVVDGLFTANLDYGTTPFNGQGLWLQIHVRPAVGGCQVCGGGCPYTLLSPRQPITAAPFALYALSGPGATGGSWSSSGPNIFNTNAGNVGIGTTGPLEQLHVRGNQATLRLEDDDDSESFTEIKDAQPTQLRINKTNSNGQVLFDFNPQPGDGTSSALVRFFRQTDTTGIKRVQFLRGNLTTSPSASIGVDGENSHFQAHGGNVGIGMTAPAARLDVLSMDSTRPARIVHDNPATGLTALRVDTNATHASVAAIAGVNTGDGPALLALTNDDSLAIKGNSINSSVSGLLDLMRINDASGDSITIAAGGGNVGIGGGTAGLPAVRLHVDGGSDASPANAVGGYVLIGSVGGANVVMDNNEIMARNNGAVSTLFINNEGGDVRIGQNGPPSTVFVPSLSVNTSCAIGTAAAPTGVKLAVDGKVLCEELEVQLSQNWPDYVFAADYELMPLEALEAHIKRDKHLPGIPSAKDIAANGLHVGDMQVRTIEKIEELTLYVIELNQALKLVKDENVELQRRIDTLEGRSNNETNYSGIVGGVEN